MRGSNLSSLIDSEELRKGLKVARVGNDFDYVVIGAGSAGCALVRNLSDRTGARILLLEAGGSDERKEIQDPTKYFGLWGSDIDWKYETVPQEFANNRTLLNAIQL